MPLAEGVPARTNGDGRPLAPPLQCASVPREHRGAMQASALRVAHRQTKVTAAWSTAWSNWGAGIAKPWSGTHRLRHSLACHLVNAGVPLKGIADVLRHRSLNTTAIYAKANIIQLTAVALPWPGRAS